MRVFIFLFISLIFILIKDCYCQQEITPEQKSWYINNLDSQDILKTRGIIQAIRNYKIIEARDKVEELFGKQDRYTQLQFLKTLYVIESTKTHEFALNYLDSLEQEITDRNLPRSGFLELMVETVDILFKLNDYSKVSYIFEILERDKPDVSISAIHLLPIVIKNVPELSNQAKFELDRTITDCSYNSGRLRAMEYYMELYGQEAIPKLINMFESDTSVTNRNIIVEKLMSRYNSSDIEAVLKQRLLIDPSPVVKISIANRLLDSYGSPDNYNYLMNFLQNETNELVFSIISSNLKQYIPQYSNPEIKINEIMNDIFYSIDQCYILTWLENESYKNLLTNELQTARNYLTQFDSLNCAKEIKSFQESIEQVHADSAGSYPKYVSDDAYKFLYYYPQYILDRLPEIPEDTAPEVRLLNSAGSLLTGGVCQYYEGGWKTATDNGDGTFSIETDKTTLSIRMTYAYGTQTLSNVPWGTGPVIFQTVTAQVCLKDSEGNFIDQGTVKYYAGGWRDFGVTENGIASKELLPNNYSFRITYAYASTDKQQNIGDDATVVFQTVLATVQLKDSQGNFIDEGTVKYYAGGWRDFGVTENGIASKELLPNNYSFRITYAYASTDKQQDMGDNPTVVFQTVPATVQLKDSQDNLIDEGIVKYYAGGWRDFGSASSGVAVKELLPNNYSFRMTYAYASNDKQQNLNDNTTVVFQTVLAAVQLKNSQGGLIDQGVVQYYSGGWRTFGTTANGVTTKELLPNNYSFRMAYAFASNDKQQNLNDNTTVIFQTVLAAVQLKNSTGAFIDQGTVQYYSGGWRNFGTTTNGVATLELLPNNYSFRMTYAFASNDKQQNIGNDPAVIFQTVPATVQLKDSQSNLIDAGSVQYYSGGWRTFGTTNNGIATLELLPNNYSFRMTHEYISNDKAQNVGVNNIVEFSTVNCIIRVNNQQTQPIDGAIISYYSGGWRQIGSTVNGEITKELLPRSLTFRATYAGTSQDKTQDTSTNNIIEFVIAQ